MCEGWVVPISTLTNIGGWNLTALAIVFLAEGQVDTLVSTSDGAGDLYCLLCKGAGVGAGVDTDTDASASAGADADADGSVGVIYYV